MGAQLGSKGEHLFQCSSGDRRSGIAKFEEKRENKSELSANGNVIKKYLEGAQTSILFPYEKLRPKCKFIYRNENKRVTVFKVTLARPIGNKEDPMYGRKELVLKSTKIGPDEQKKVDNMIREYYIGRTFGCCSKNVAKVLDMKSKVDQDGGRVIEILSEYGGESLLEYKDKLEKGDVARMMLQLVNVLALMDVVGVAHNDIKPGNLVWDPTTGVLKIIDFGSSISMFQTPEALKKAADAFHARQVSGFTKYFGPPEVCQEPMDPKKYVPQKVDEFCFAMTFIIMLFYEHKLNIDTLPPRGKTEKELEEYVRKVKEILVDEGEGAWIGLLCGCLAYEPNGRLTFSSIKETFEAIVEMHHPDLIRTTVESKIDELKLADAYYYMREYDVAVRFYEKELNKNCYYSKKELCFIYKHLGCSYAYLGQFEKAKSNLNEHLSMCVDIFGKDHLNVAWSYIYRGNLYNEFGNYDDAIKDYLKGKEMLKKKTSMVCSRAAISVSSALGEMYTYMQNVDEALKHFIEAQVIGERLLEKTSPELAETYSSLGRCLMNRGNYGKAKEYLEKAKKIEASINKSSHGSPEFLRLYIDLGDYYKETKKYEESKKFYSQALEMIKEEYGEESRGIADIYSRLGKVCTYLKEFEEAHKYYILAIEIKKKTYQSATAFGIADVYQKGGRAYSLQGYDAVAIQYYSKALEIKKKVLGEAHPDIVKTYHSLGISYSKLDDSEHTIEYYLKALEIYEKMDVTKEKRTGFLIAIANGDLGTAYHRSNKNEDAVVYLKKALELLENMPELNKNLHCFAGFWHTLVFAYRSLGRYEEAISYIHRVISIYKVTNGETHDDLAGAYTELAILQHGLNKLNDAIDSGFEALKILKTNHGEVHADVAKTYLDLGIDYLRTDRLALALHYFGESEKIYNQLPEFGLKHQKLACLYQYESEIYLKLGNIDKSKELAAMAKSIL